MADIVAGFTVADLDAELVDDLRERSEAAFATLISMYQRPIYNFAFRLVGDPSDAADVTQEVFLKVFRNIGEFRGDCSLKTWLYRIAVNEASNLRRWFLRHRRHQLSLDCSEPGVPAFVDVLPDPQESQYERVLRQERVQAVTKALSRVKDSFRVAVVLRDIEGLSYEEIAEILQVSLGTVKSRILRGREALKRHLGSLAADRSVAPGALQTVE